MAYTCAWCGKNMGDGTQGEGAYCSRKCKSEDPNRDAQMKAWGEHVNALGEVWDPGYQTMEKLLREARALEEKGEQGKANQTRAKAVKIYMKKGKTTHTHTACRFFMDHDRWPSQEEVDEEQAKIPPTKPLEIVGWLVFIMFAIYFWIWLLG